MIITKEQEETLAKQGGIESSLSEDEIKGFLPIVLSELKCAKGREIRDKG